MDTLAAAYGHLLTARLMLERELSDHPDSYALQDAVNLTDDACSQLRGEFSARLPERPILGSAA